MNTQQLNICESCRSSIHQEKLMHTITNEIMQIFSLHFYFEVKLKTHFQIYFLN